MYPLLFNYGIISIGGYGILLGLAFYLGFSVDLMSRLEISPCSISVLRLERNQPHILAINRTTLEEILEK